MIEFKTVVVYVDELEAVKEKLNDSMKFLIPNARDLNKNIKYGKDINEFIKLRNLIQKSINQINKLLAGIKQNPLWDFEADEIKYYSDYIALLTYFNIKGGRDALDKLAYESDQGKNWEQMRMGYSSPRGLIEDNEIDGHYVQAFIKAIKSMSPKARSMTNAAIIKQLKKSHRF